MVIKNSENLLHETVLRILILKLYEIKLIQGQESRCCFDFKITDHSVIYLIFISTENFIPFKSW